MNFVQYVEQIPNITIAKRTPQTKVWGVLFVLAPISDILQSREYGDSHIQGRRTDTKTSTSQIGVRLPGRRRGS